MPSPPLRLEVDAYLMVLGARSGSERLSLSVARTTFGREEADVNLSDRAVSRRHFQIEAMGREFFIRDLESHNGTFLNGAKIRYSQLLPGDEIVAGNMVLIFRLSDDGIDRSGS